MMVKRLNICLKELSKKNNVLFLLSLIFAFSVSTVVGIGDYDFIWQTHLGKTIITEHRFDGLYDLIWGTQGLGWYLDHEWLTNVIFYLLNCCFGLVGSIVVYKIIIELALSISIYFLVKEFIDDFSNMSWFTYLACVTMSWNFSMLLVKPKAYDISLVLFIWLIIILERYKKQVISYKSLCVITTVLLLFWNNLHSGSVVLFFGIFGAYWLFCFRDKKTFLLCCIEILFLCINPFGYWLPYFDITHFSDSVMKEVITEWRGFSVDDFAGKSIALFIGIAYLHLLHMKREKENWVYFFLFAVFMLLNLMSIRHYLYLYPIIVILFVKGQYKDLKKWPVKSFFMPTLFILLMAGYLEIVAWLGMSEFPTKYIDNYITDELRVVLADTLSKDNNGFYDGDINVWSEGYKSFRTGAFPFTRERVIDSVHMEKGSSITIRQVIEKYGLNKFLCVKYRKAEDGVTFTPRHLYDYLRDTDRYTLLYEDDYLAYFVDKEVLE